MSVQWFTIGNILEVAAKDSNDRWMKWGQAALSCKLLAHRYQTHEKFKRTLLRNDPVYYNGTYQWIKLWDMLKSMVLGLLRIMRYAKIKINLPVIFSDSWRWAKSALGLSRLVHTSVVKTKNCTLQGDTLGVMHA